MRVQRQISDVISAKGSPSREYLILFHSITILWKVNRFFPHSVTALVVSQLTEILNDQILLPAQRLQMVAELMAQRLPHPFLQRFPVQLGIETFKGAIVDGDHLAQIPAAVIFSPGGNLPELAKKLQKTTKMSNFF